MRAGGRSSSSSSSTSTSAASRHKKKARYQVFYLICYLCTCVCRLHYGCTSRRGGFCSPLVCDSCDVISLRQFIKLHNLRMYFACSSRASGRFVGLTASRPQVASILAPTGPSCGVWRLLALRARIESFNGWCLSHPSEK